MNELLDTAIELVSQGISVIPVGYRSKVPRIPWTIYRKRLPRLDELTDWFDGCDSNLGVVCGFGGLAVLDFDSEDAYDIWRVYNLSNPIGVEVDRTSYAVLTSRGRHVYVYLDEPVSNMPLGFMDVKGLGGYVLAPPSIHPTGYKYCAAPGNRNEIVRVPGIRHILPAAWIEGRRLAPAQVQTVKVDLNQAAAWDIANSGRLSNPVAAIKQWLRIEDILPGGVRAGRTDTIMVRCPFHDDRNPSFWINTKSQICGCYAGCTPRPMDAIDLYARLHNLSVVDAIKQLAAGKL